MSKYSLKLAKEELQKSQKHYKKQYNKKAKPRCLEVGDQVLILLPITAEAVPEALLDNYSRVDIPEKVLTDHGTQIMSECMQEVSRLLNLKGVASTPYHPIGNVLFER